MLNCCVAEQHRARALARPPSAPAPAEDKHDGRDKDTSIDRGGDGDPGGSSPLVHEDGKGTTEGGRAADPGFNGRGLVDDETGRWAAAGTTAREAAAAAAAAAGSETGEGGGHSRSSSDGRHGGEGSDNARARQREAGRLDGGDSSGNDAKDSAGRKQAAFAAERDAILRRVGVKKEGATGGGSS
ncbi:unnamed protein product, partial [Ectocarpus sp. 8 AP-2014]